MRRTIAVLSLVILLLSFAGCDTLDALIHRFQGASASELQSASSSESSGEPGAESEESSAPMPTQVRIHPTGGYATGQLEDTLATAFFDFSVLSVELCDEYDGYTAAPGNMLVNALIKVSNTCGEDVTMYAADFQFQWGDGELDFGYPLSSRSGKKDVPKKYTLHPFESLEYYHVFEVPADTTRCSISYLEFFKDETQGDLFFVYFDV